MLKKSLKKIVCLLSIMSVLFLISCSNPVNGDDVPSGISGCYKYITSVSNVESVHYFEFDSNGDVLRAGTADREWTSKENAALIENARKTMTYQNLYASQNDYTKLIKISVNEMPSWYKSGNNSVSDKTTFSVTFYQNNFDSNYISTVTDDKYFLCVTESYTVSGLLGDLSPVFGKTVEVNKNEMYKLPVQKPTLHHNLYNNPISHWSGSPYYWGNEDYEYDETIYNYEFDNWNTKSDGSGISYSSGDSIVITEDIILYPIYKTNYSSVEKKYNGGIVSRGTNNLWKLEYDGKKNTLYLQNDGYVYLWSEKTGNPFEGTWTRSESNGKKSLQLNLLGEKTVEYELVDNNLVITGKIFYLLPENTTWIR